jgi:hypothetical protein
MALSSRVEDLAAPNRRVYRNALLTTDFPRGHRRAFNAIARTLPGARRWGHEWLVPLAIWLAVRGTNDPPPACWVCGQSIEVCPAWTSDTPFHNRPPDAERAKGPEAPCRRAPRP